MKTALIAFMKRILAWMSAEATKIEPAAAGATATATTGIVSRFAGFILTAVKTVMGWFWATIKAPFKPFVTTVLVIARSPSTLIVLVPLGAVIWLGGQLSAASEFHGVMIELQNKQTEALKAADAKRVADVDAATVTAAARIKALEDELTALQTAKPAAKAVVKKAAPAPAKNPFAALLGGE